MAEEDVTLELLLNKATSPALHDDDWDAIAAFCDQVNKELEGPQFAVRLLAHKIQSPTEREALCALSTLEACVKNCGRTFHQEIGKFRFLNEIIKVVSPKYLGTKATERVKKRCIELLYSWHKGLPHEAKIGEAYKMLKTQCIIKEDPTYMDKTFDPFPPPKPRRAEFEDEEKAKQLSRLLKSKNPDDLQAANRLIKNMVKEDVEKSERRSRRINELESINNQVKLLTEMVNCYGSSSSRADIEMMKELYENLEKQRPKLFRLASETEEHESDAINEILKVNDAVTRAMSIYMARVQGVADENCQVEEGAARDTSLLDLGFDSPARHAQGSSEPASGASAILQSDFQSLGLDDVPPAGSPYNQLTGLFGAQQQQQQQQLQQQQQQQQHQAAMGGGLGAAGMPAHNMMVGGGFRPPVMGQNMPPAYAMPSAGFPSQQQQQQQQKPLHQLGNLSMVQTSVFSGTPSASAATASSSGAAAGPSAMADLDAFSESLLEKNRSKDFVKPPVGPPPKMSMNQLAASKAAPPQQQPPPPLQSSSTSLLDSEITPPPVLAPVTSASQNSLPVSNTNTNNVDHPALSLMDKDDDDSMFSEMVSAPIPPPPPPSQELLPLTDVFVALESIKPAEDVSPVTAYDKHGIKSMIHFSTNRPRPDVLVMVLSTLSTNSKAVKNFMFQAAVPKAMKVKLQPPSTTNLPAYNPILPPSAITQVLLVANPRKEKVRLKFKISYVLGEEPITDVGDAEEFPIQ